MEPLLTLEQPGEPGAMAAWLNRHQGRPNEAASVEQREYERYLTELRTRQAEYASQLGEARRMLVGSVAEIAAVHARLTQQFLDAQRGLIARAVEAADQIAAVGGADTVDAHAVVLGLDIAGFETRMRSQLDRWWSDEAAAVQHAVDAAVARDEVRRHLERIERSEAVRAAAAIDVETGSAAGETVPDQVDAIPAGVLALIEAAELDDLDSLFEALIDVLMPPATDALAETATNEAVTSPVHPSPTPAPVPARSADGAEEQFARFWGSGPAPVGSGRRPWRFVQMLLPTSVVVAGLALVLAWVG